MIQPSFNFDPLTRRRAWVLLPILAGAFVLSRGLAAPTSGDYAIHSPVAGDNAGPAIDALIHGHLASFIGHQPLMGLTSIVVRAPFAAAATALGGTERLAYALGAMACLLPLMLLAAWMSTRLRATPRQLMFGAASGVLLLAGPATWQAIAVGHPEEVLASTLGAAAVIAAGYRRPGLAGVTLGLAIGTKQWALLAAAPVLLAAKDHRAKTAVLAGGIGIALAATLPLADPAAFLLAKSEVFGSHLSDPFSVWWPFGSALSAPLGGAPAVSAHRLPLGLTRSSASFAPLLIASGALVAFALHRRRRGYALDPLALLALLGLLRCVVDPTPLQYNFVDVLIPLATWEAVTLVRAPVVTSAATGWVWLVTAGLVHADPRLVSTLSIAGAVGLSIYLGVRAFGAREVRRDNGLTLWRHRPITPS